MVFFLECCYTICMEEITLDPIVWSAPEYTHKERSMDWFWTIGLVSLVGALVALWFHNYIFSLFILISGASLILFTLRAPHIFTFTVNTQGITIEKETYTWKDIQGFTIKKSEPSSKLLILTSKKFLPVYTLPFPSEITQTLRESLLKVSKPIELEESHSMLFMEKIGF